MLEREALSILLVEDMPALREFFKIVGGMAQCEVSESPDAWFALKYLEGNIPDAIITDFQMPGMDGREFTRQVRARGISIPIAMVTGRAPYFSSDEIDEIHRDGIEIIRDKPVGFNQTVLLFEEVRDMVQSYRNK